MAGIINTFQQPPPWLSFSPSPCNQWCGGHKSNPMGSVLNVHCGFFAYRQTDKQVNQQGFLLCRNTLKKGWEAGKNVLQFCHSGVGMGVVYDMQETVSNSNHVLVPCA